MAIVIGVGTVIFNPAHFVHSLPERDDSIMKPEALYLKKINPLSFYEK